MALIRNSSLEAARNALVAAYNETFKRTPSNVSELVMTQPVNENKFIHSFIVSWPDFRDWTDEKHVNSVKVQSLVGKTDKKELTVGVDVEDLMSSVLQPFVSQIGNLGYKAATLTDKQVAEFLINGTSSNTKYKNFDDKPLFATDHPRDDGSTQSNSNTSQALDAANLIESFEQMLALTDMHNAPLSIFPTHLVVPSALFLTAKALVENPLDAYGATNVMYNRLKVVHLPELDAYPTTWYLMAVQGGTPPFIKYELEAPVDTILDSESDHNYFWNDQVIFGSVARQSVYAGPWMLVQKNVQ